MDKIKRNPLIRKLIWLFGDSVVWYIALLITSVMWHYNGSYEYSKRATVLYGIAALILSALLTKLFNFIDRHKYIGPLVYVAVFMIGMFIVGYIVSLGQLNYPVEFLTWFLTPQDALAYSGYYTFAMFVFITGFFNSVTYYFTKVRYRIFMGFLIFIIPFIIYGKEYVKMPVGFIIALAIFYFIIMANYRQIHVKTDEVVIIGKIEMWKCILVFALIFGSAAAVMPKPKIEADRTALENMLSGGGIELFTDRLLRAISVFLDDSSSERFTNLADDMILYYINSSKMETQNLKTLTFTHYDYTTDKWSISNDDEYYYTSETVTFDNNITDIMYGIALTAEADGDFAEKYGLTDINHENVKTAETYRLYMYTAGHDARKVPVPSWYSHVVGSGGDQPIKSTINGTFFNLRGNFDRNESFDIECFSQEYMYRPDVQKILSVISFENNYAELLDEAYHILMSEGEEMTEARRTVLKAEKYAEGDFTDYLNYGDSERIKNLALEITEGLTSDIDKAEAIENYFLLNGYTYNISHKVKEGENVETFIFETKTGLCYQYASSMVLLARAAGIPARYAEGYMMNELGVGLQNYSDVAGCPYNGYVRIRDGHAFPELFIGGIGWTTFEPTMSNSIIEPEMPKTSTEKLKSAGIILIIVGTSAFILYKIEPFVYQLIFMFCIKRTKGNKAIRMIVKRLRKLYKLGDEKTSVEIMQTVFGLNPNDATVISTLFDRTVYGEKEITKSESVQSIKIYHEAYRKYKVKDKRKGKS